jgi:hypothetical protein
MCIHITGGAGFIGRILPKFCWLDFQNRVAGFYRLSGNDEELLTTNQKALEIFPKRLARMRPIE